MSSLRRWRALQVVSGREKDVQRELADKVLPLAPELETFVPVEKVVKIQRGKRTFKEVSIYPGYVFIFLQELPEVVSAVQRTKGVLAFLDGAGVEGLSEEDIIQMKEKATLMLQAFVPEEEENTFASGDEVRVREGCFLGTEGVVRSVSNGKVNIQVVAFDKTTFLELPFGFVKKID